MDIMVKKYIEYVAENNVFGDFLSKFVDKLRGVSKKDEIEISEIKKELPKLDNDEEVERLKEIKRLEEDKKQNDNIIRILYKIKKDFEINPNKEKAGFFGSPTKQIRYNFEDNTKIMLDFMPDRSRGELRYYIENKLILSYKIESSTLNNFLKILFTMR